MHSQCTSDKWILQKWPSKISIWIKAQFICMVSFHSLTRVEWDSLLLKNDDTMSISFYYNTVLQNRDGVLSHLWSFFKAVTSPLPIKLWEEDLWDKDKITVILWDLDYRLVVWKPQTRYCAEINRIVLNPEVVWKPDVVQKPGNQELFSNQGLSRSFASRRLDT